LNHGLRLLRCSASVTISTAPSSPREAVINNCIRQVSLSNGVRFSLVHGDLTRAPVEAIINAANARLQHGGGVAGAISRSGGGSIQRESNAWVERHGPISPDRPALTGAGTLPCQYVIHAVGPVWGEGDEDQKLSMAVSSALQLAEEEGMRSVALPAISTGIFGFPKPRAASVILAALEEYAVQHPTPSLQEVWLVLWDNPTLEIFMKAFDDGWPEASGKE
jgi:O-acetyl-ADP-ribose deacetylase (regulator of RNase III)